MKISNINENLLNKKTKFNQKTIQYEPIFINDNNSDIKVDDFLIKNVLLNNRNVIKLNNSSLILTNSLFSEVSILDGLRK